ncbi:Fc.00g108190.m01.CDS01 [Cosmosporella sp. VM-42]
MGNNLSTFVVPDTSADVISPPDRANAIRLAVFWAGALYGCAMIFSTCALIDRWKGPYDRNRTGFGSVLAALLLSTAWPVVLAYLLVSAW